MTKGLSYVLEKHRMERKSHLNDCNVLFDGVSFAKSSEVLELAQMLSAK